MSAATTYPLLIAIDYAQTRRSQATQVLNALAARRDGSPVRVLLLARAPDNWWPSVCRSLCRSWRGTRVMSTSASMDIDVADALHSPMASPLSTPTSPATRTPWTAMRSVDVRSWLKGRRCPVVAEPGVLQQLDPLGEGVLGVCGDAFLARAAHPDRPRDEVLAPDR
ncbi:hypothetical protein [Streptomyces sp. NPDC006195]|uniref:hypothetical protein n=1 Tax=unclassified Streptomyces TaxID=2593676 RepID=UPI0033A97814